MPELGNKHSSRLMFQDYEDALWTAPNADFVQASGRRVHPTYSRFARCLSSICDLGDGGIDLPACHRSLNKFSLRAGFASSSIRCVKGHAAVMSRCGTYVVNKLEPIYS